MVYTPLVYVANVLSPCSYWLSQFFSEYLPSTLLHPSSSDSKQTENHNDRK